MSIIGDVTNTQAATISRRPGARFALALLLGINLFNYVDRYVLAAVEPEIARTFFGGAADSATLAKTGALATAFLLSYMLTAPLFGWLADRMSRWVLVGISVLVWSLATGGSGLAATFSLLVITRCFVGIGEAGYGPAAPTIISDMYPVSRRGAVLSWFYMAIPVGSAIGYAIGGHVAAAHGWRMAFYVVTPPGILLGILALMMRDPPRGQFDRPADERPGAEETQARPGDAGERPVLDYASPPPRARAAEYLSLLRNRSYVYDTLGMAAMTFAIGGISYWMPRYLTEVRMQPASAKTTFGILTAIAGFFATLAGGLAGDALKKRFPGSYFIVSGAAVLIACPFVILMLFTPFPLAWLMIFIASFFLFFNTGPSNTILANVTAPSIRATAFAMNIFIIHLLGDAPSPPILGAIGGGRFGWGGAFGLVAVMMAVAGVLWLMGARHLAPDTARASGENGGANG